MCPVVVNVERRGVERRKKRTRVIAFGHLLSRDWSSSLPGLIGTGSAGRRGRRLRSPSPLPTPNPPAFRSSFYQDPTKTSGDLQSAAASMATRYPRMPHVGRSSRFALILRRSSRCRWSYSCYSLAESSLSPWIRTALPSPTTSSVGLSTRRTFFDSPPKLLLWVIVVVLWDR